MVNTSTNKIILNDSHKIISFAPTLAEEKALQRIENPVDENELITMGEIDEEIDMEKVKERIKQRGYKIKVSSAN